jgi:hypothetical protein
MRAIVSLRVVSVLVAVLAADGCDTAKAPSGAAASGAAAGKHPPNVSTVPTAGMQAPSPDVECARDAECPSHYCARGTCVSGLACSSRAVTCDQESPACGDGTTPSVRDGCWGACVPAEDCADVDDCARCGKGQICVRTFFEVGAQGPFERISCSKPPARCSTRDCECLGELCAVGRCAAFDDVLRCSAGADQVSE